MPAIEYYDVEITLKMTRVSASESKDQLGSVSAATNAIRTAMNHPDVADWELVSVTATNLKILKAKL